MIPSPSRAAVCWFLTLAPLAAASDVDIGGPQVLGAVENVGSNTAGDLDGDGDVDVLIATATGTLLWRNPGTDGGSWTTEGVPLADQGGVYALQFADMDLDGDADVVHADQFGLHWTENAAGDAGTWTEHLVPFFILWTRDLTVADVDGDGDPDILFVNAHPSPAPQGYGWVENLDGAARAWALHHWESVDMHRLDAADVDGDGDVDMVVADINDGPLFWRRNEDGAGLGWSAPQIIDEGAWNGDPTAVDMDGDGDPDLLVPRQDSMALWENDLGGAGWVEHVLDEDDFKISGDDVDVADLDGDGDLDVLLGQVNFQDVYWYENLDGQATAWQERPVYLAPGLGQPEGIFGEDVDEDGDTDLLLVTRAEVAAFANLTWSDEGHGLPGATEPRLRGLGPLTAGSATWLRLSGLPEQGTGFLVLGFSDLAAAFKGGVLVPSPDAVVPVPTADGSLTVGFPWPAGAPTGLAVFVQAWLPDGSGPVGFTATNGLRATTP